MALAFRSEHHFFNRANKVILCNLHPILARGEDRSLVHERVKLGTRETRRALGNDGQSDIRPQWLFARMNLEDLLAVSAVWQVNGYASVEAPRSQKRWVQHVRTVRRRHDDDFFCWFEAVHLNKNLIERLFALVITAANARPAHAPDRVNLINKNNCGRGFLRYLKEVAHARCSHSHKHLHKLRRSEEHTSEHQSQSKLAS